MLRVPAWLATKSVAFGDVSVQTKKSSFHKDLVMCRCIVFIFHVQCVENHVIVRPHVAAPSESCPSCTGILNSSFLQLLLPDEGLLKLDV